MPFLPSHIHSDDAYVTCLFSQHVTVNAPTIRRSLRAQMS